MSKYTLTIEQDDYPSSPRECDNLGTMACWHSRYLLGDKTPKESYHDYLCSIAEEAIEISIKVKFWENQERNSITEERRGHCRKMLRRAIASGINQHIILPLYLYDHSGITMSTGSFVDKWDSGQVGIISVSKEKVRKEFGWKRITRDRLKKIEDILKGEVETYDTYLRGDVWRYVICDENGESVESCCGFYDEDDARQEGLSTMRYLEREETSRRNKKLKELIKKRVPLELRATILS